MIKTQSQPKNWQKVKLGDICRIKTGKTDSQDAVENGAYPLFDRSATIKRSDKFLFDTSAIILPGEGQEFAPRFYEGKFDLHQRVYAIYCDQEKRCDNLSLKFLYYFLLLNREYFAQTATGATVKSLRLPIIADCPVALPPLSIQKQIADVLSVYDDLIENNTKRIKILEEMAQAIFKEWFVYFRFPGHEKIKMVDSKTEFGKIPEGWGVKKIGDIFDVKYGKNLPTSKIQASGDYPVYGAGGVIGFYNEQNSNGKVALVTCRGNGSGTVWRTRGLGFVTNNSFTVSPKEEYKYADFTTVYFALKNANVDSAISGSAQPQITIESFDFVNVLLPEEGLLKSFQNAVSRFFDLMDSLFVENQNLRQARDLLLLKLVTGEIKI